VVNSTHHLSILNNEKRVLLEKRGIFDLVKLGNKIALLKHATDPKHFNIFTHATEIKYLSYNKFRVIIADKLLI